MGDELWADAVMATGDLRSTIDRLAREGRFDAANSEQRVDWPPLDGRVADDLRGKRVLDVGGGRAYAFAARGAAFVLACPDVAAGSVVKPQRIELRAGGWRSLDPDGDGVFALVHCRSCLALEPMALLRTLRAMTAPDGELLIAAVQLADPELSEYVRVFPAGLLLPGRLAFRWLVQAAGFELQEESGERPGRWGNVLTLNSYIRARPV